MAYTQSEIERAYQHYAGEATAKQHFNALEHTANVMESSRSLAERVERIVAKFIGPTLAEASNGPQAGGPGIFHQLHRVSEDTGYAIRKANEALDRLEKELA